MCCGSVSIPDELFLQAAEVIKLTMLFFISIPTFIVDDLTKSYPKNKFFELGTFDCPNFYYLKAQPH